MDKLWRRIKSSASAATTGLGGLGSKRLAEDPIEELAKAGRKVEEEHMKRRRRGESDALPVLEDGADSLEGSAASQQTAGGNKWLNGVKFDLDRTKSDLNDDQRQQQQRPQSSAALYDCITPMTKSRLHTLAQIGEDWLYLALLGIIMALLSIGMDFMISMFLDTRIWLSNEASGQNLLVEYLAWCLMPILLVSFSTGFVHLCSPTAIGSGIPEMKTILRGVVLNEYLTFRTLVAKIVGLTFTLGSGLPLGKEGPSVHMASIVATLLSKLVASFQGIYENESRTSEMLSAACAVGVAATFYAPIGGVLFSIEVTTVYFAVRNYWRGFFAACCGATIWRLLGFYIQNDESISAIFKTKFNTDYPFDPVELLLFSFIGATCGLGAAAYIKFHREIVQFFRRHKRISGYFQQNRFVYPTLVTLIITTSTFPPLFGKYTAATLSTHTTIEHLFSNRTWSIGDQDLVSRQILDTWTTESTGFHLHLVLYILMLFWTSALASTIPTPSGVFIPVVKMGAAYGRLVGELMAAAYPEGIKYTHPAKIVPGSYAVVGAAAFSGAVTHTVSTSVILFEMTGQIVHIIPVILGVLISNAVCQSLQPSIYDSIIEIKKLPYLPPIASSNSISHRILVRDFMNKKSIPFVWKDRCTYADLKALLSSHRKIISFPLVESPLSMKLLGSVARPDLLKLLYMHLGRERRLQEVCRRNSDTLTPAIHLLNTISGRHLTGTINEHTLDECRANGKTNSLAAQPGEVASKKTSLDSSTSSEDRGIEFITIGGIQQDCDQPQEVVKPKQPMGHVTMLPAPNINAKATSQVGSNMNGLAKTNYKLHMDNDDDDDDDDNDPTQLIISSNKNCHMYGATSSEPGSQTHSGSLDRTTSKEVKVNSGLGNAISRSRSSPIGPKARFGEEKLLNECQKRECAADEVDKEFGGVAKFINHYDRGSTMDKDHLERSIQEVEGHMAMAQHRNPEIVVVVDALRGGEHGGQNASHNLGPSCDGGLDGSDLSLNVLRPPEEPAGRTQPRAIMRHKIKHTDGYTGDEDSTSKQLPILKLSPAPSPAFQHHHRKYQPLSHSVSSSPSLSSRPFKSILKTSSCHNMAKKPKSAMNSPSINRNVSIVGRRSSRMASDSFKPEETNQEQNRIPLGNDQRGTNENLTPTNAAHISNLRFANAPDLLSHKSQALDLDLETGERRPQEIRQRRKVRLPRLRVVDMTPEEQEQWEKEQLSAFIELDKCQIDEAPFQLVEQTSLYRVHTLFSMLGLNHAYVTSFGRLVGIVALKDIRNAIEKMLQSKV